MTTTKPRTRRRTLSYFPPLDEDEARALEKSGHLAVYPVIQHMTARRISIDLFDRMNNLLERVAESVKNAPDSPWHGISSFLEIAVFIEDVRGDWSLFDGGPSEFSSEEWPPVDTDELDASAAELMKRCRLLRRLDAETKIELTEAIFAQIAPSEAAEGN